MKKQRIPVHGRPVNFQVSGKMGEPPDWTLPCMDALSGLISGSISPAGTGKKNIY
ncbi:MAG: hypothetical protein LUQ04_10515 [Methanoregula sp.]|nr:hypothetical protein [Methanoregula sp.]